MVRVRNNVEAVINDSVSKASQVLSSLRATSMFSVVRLLLARHAVQSILTALRAQRLTLWTVLATKYTREMVCNHD